MTNRRQLIDAVEVTDTGIHVVRLKQIFDATSVSEFEKVLGYLLARQYYRIVVDLTHVEFVASAGWGAFTAEFRNVRKAGGDIRLAGMNPDVQDVFFLLELDSFINSYNTVDEAVASFEAEMPAAGTQTAVAPVEKKVAEHAQAEVHQGGEEAFESAEAEPVAFEVAEVYDPAYRSPLALGPGTMKPKASEYEVLAPTNNEMEEESWIVSEEVETESTEITSYAAEEDFAPEMTFDAVDEAADKEDTVLPRPPEALTGNTQPQNWAAAEAAQPSVNNRSRVNSEEWPDAHAEENVALEDFELQDIHDPWILEEIDTLPEEDEIEEAVWSENESGEDAQPSMPVRSGLARASARPLPREIVAPAPAKPRTETTLVTRAAAQASERMTQNANKMAPEPKLAPRPAALETPNVKPALADKVKAASKPQALKRAENIAKVQLEGDRIEIVRQIVSEHPHYGPAMIQKYFETRLEPPVPVSRSTVYRWLRLAGLNTREQRLDFAGHTSS